MTTPITLTAVLLAGGQSRRMGTDKATLLFAGEPLWARQLRVLRELGPESLFVSARARPAWCPAEVEVVLDEGPARGPLSGVAAALARMQTTHLLVLAVDLPRMTTGHLRILREHALPGCGVVPVREGRFEPLCAIYPRQAAVYAAEALTGEDVSLRSFVRRLQAEGLIQTMAVSAEDDRLYLNLNEPSDLHKEN